MRDPALGVHREATALDRAEQSLARAAALLWEVRTRVAPGDPLREKIDKFLGGDNRY